MGARPRQASPADEGWQQFAQLVRSVNAGDLMVIAACFAYATYSIALRWRPPAHWMSIFVVSTIGAIGASFFYQGIIGGGVMAFFEQLPTISTEGWLIVAYTIIFPSVISQILYVRGVELIGSNRASLFVNLIPIFGTIGSVLVLGGSLGARRINQLVESQLEEFDKNGLQLIWQTGSLYFNEYKKYGEKEGVRTLEFLNRMDLAYAAADVIISRAGAGTVSELCIAGKPVVFIPSPNVAEDHQTKNAQALAEKDAAVVIAESNLNSSFQEVFYPLLGTEEKMQRLSVNIKKLAKPFATSHIVDEIEKLISRKK